MKSLLLLLLIPLSVLAQTVLINEIMSSNSQTIVDEDGDYPDWLELYNPSQSAVDLTGFGLSDDLDEPFKWIFPSVNLAPKDYLLIYASEKDRRDWQQWGTIIDWGDTWRYFQGVSEPPGTWRQISFDDSRWPQGPSGFGYGDGDDATTVGSTISLYLRKSFTLEDTSQIMQAELYVDNDDAFVAYLNDVEIARANIGVPGDHPGYRQTALGNREAQLYQGGKPEKFVVPNTSALFRQGKNVLALQVHNASQTSSDLSIIPFLLVKVKAPLPGIVSGVPAVLKDIMPRLHTNFKLSADGDHLTLTNASGQTVDIVNPVAIPSDVSYGRSPDGGNNWTYFTQATPGTSNSSAKLDSLLKPPSLSLPSGFYSGSISVELSCPSPLGKIYYALDGAEPTEKSFQYQSPISISKTTVVRAKAWAPECLPSDIATQSYFINERSTLPIISLVTDPPNLWDEETGIYTMGPNPGTEYPYFSANFWQDWERPVHAEIFETDGQLAVSLDAGLKIYGAWARAYPQKSLSIHVRGKYGTDALEYQIFPDLPIDSFQSIVLRNSGNDWESTMFRDALMHRLVRNMDIDALAYRPAIVFLNGAYWGIHNIREKINEHYLASHHGCHPDSVDILEKSAEVVLGENTHYLAMINFISAHDLSVPANYAHLLTLMDVHEFMEYMIAQIFIDNTDWPGNNIKFWKPRRPDGRWRWIMYDTDFGFGLYNQTAFAHNTLDFALATNGPDWPNPPWSTFLLRNLLKNDTFRREFITLFSDHLNTTFAPARINQLIDELKAGIEAEMPRHQARWPRSAVNWLKNIQDLRNFANKRATYVRSHILHKFQLQGGVRINLAVSTPNSGTIKINSQMIDAFPWNGYYFANLPVHLTALPASGYRFAGWSDSTLGQNASTEILPRQDMTVTALFEQAQPTSNNIVINEINYNSSSSFNPEDWVELYNPSDSATDVSSWVFKDEDDNHIYQFPAQTILPARGFLVLVKDTTLFRAQFPQVTNRIGPFVFGFDGAGELVRLYNNTNTLVDSLTYDDVPPWPAAADGQGFTLELKDASLDNSLASSWAASLHIGGTPGKANSVATEVTDRPSTVQEFGLLQNYPNPFNPETTIEYQLPRAEEVEISILNLRGQHVAKLVKGNQTGGEHKIIWNGADESGRRVASGVYLYQFKAGDFEAVKKMVVLH